MASLVPMPVSVCLLVCVFSNALLVLHACMSAFISLVCNCMLGFFDLHASLNCEVS